MPGHPSWHANYLYGFALASRRSMNTQDVGQYLPSEYIGDRRMTLLRHRLVSRRERSAWNSGALHAFPAGPTSFGLMFCAILSYRHFLGRKNAAHYAPLRSFALESRRLEQSLVCLICLCVSLPRAVRGPGVEERVFRSVIFYQRNARATTRRKLRSLSLSEKKGRKKKCWPRGANLCRD